MASITYSKRSRAIRYLVVFAALLTFLYEFRHQFTHQFTHLPHLPDMTSFRTTAPKSHPIDHLIDTAETEFQSLLGQQVEDLSSAAKAYRDKRGRHPPPGFDAWFDFAKRQDAIIVEDFWDQIYHDLTPFWALSPKRIRYDARAFEMTVSIRNGTASTGSEWFWTQIWLDLFASISEYLPDMDIPLNAMDEPRLVVPWEKIDMYMQIERSSRKIMPVSEVKQGYPARKGCPPNSLARTSQLAKDFSSSPEISVHYAEPHSYQGYVSNYTLSTSICHQPDLQGLHGALIHPLTVSSSDYLFPLFGGSKLATNNDILLPAPMYWKKDARFVSVQYDVPWTEKNASVVWRGTATGGRNNATNWKAYHRHRFVAMTNSTQVKLAEIGEMPPIDWALPDDIYQVEAFRDGHLGDWLAAFTDTGFTDLMCSELQADGGCSYYDNWFKTVEGIPLSDQFHNKYLVDIDGNSFSGRYRAFMQSNSLPIKSTLFREWHDSRLVAWKHFVPMDNRFGDFYGIMEYFRGVFDTNGTHDLSTASERDIKAERIASEGQAWALKVLRPEDMQIYVFRLLLEYARVSHDERSNLGFVQDLVD